MPHIHTTPGEYDHTASAYIVDISGDEPRLLLHMHKKFAKLFQPGGHIETNEHAWDTLRHELLEETGYNFDQLRIIQPKYLEKLVLRNFTKTIHPVHFLYNSHPVAGLNHNHSDSVYLFTTIEAPANLPGEDESTDLRWLTLQEINDYPEDEISSMVKDAAALAFEVALSDEWVSLPTSRFK
jgi:8-oxo-dGTP diphosphatase